MVFPTQSRVEYNPKVFMLFNLFNRSIYVCYSPSLIKQLLFPVSQPILYFTLSKLPSLSVNAKKSMNRILS